MRSVYRLRDDSLFAPVSVLRVIFVRLSFECYVCSARLSIDKKYQSVRRLLDRWAKNEPVPYFRCHCCRKMALGLDGNPEWVR